MSNRESRPEIFTTPLAGGKPIGVPIPLDEAFGEAVELTAAHFPEVDLGDILKPAKNSKAEIAHWALLLVLDGAGVKPGALARELKYKSRKILLAEREVARVALAEEDSARLRLEIMNTKYHKFLRRMVAAAAGQAAEASQQLISPSAEPQTDQRPPALSADERRIISGFQSRKRGSHSALEHEYLEQIIDFIHELDPDIPDDTIDIAMRVLKEHAAEVDVNSPISFIDGLLVKIEAGIAVHKERQAVYELTKGLDVQEYYNELQDYDQQVTTRQIKTNLDSASIDTVINSAIIYFKRRFYNKSDLVVPEMEKIDPVNRGHLTRGIKEAFRAKLTRNLKLSARMYEREGKDFHLAQLHPYKQEVYYGILLEEVTRERIDHYLKRPRRRKK